MRFFRQHVGIPVLLLFLMLLDGQISTLIASFLPIRFHLVCHLVLIFLLFISVELSDVTAFTIFLVIGILYDAYYFHVIGIATLLLPLLSVLVNKYNTIMMGNKITRFLSVLIISITEKDVEYVTPLLHFYFFFFIINKLFPKLVAKLVKAGN